jgi:hypothetical protein
MRDTVDKLSINYQTERDIFIEDQKGAAVDAHEYPVQACCQRAPVVRGARVVAS